MNIAIRVWSIGGPPLGLPQYGAQTIIAGATELLVSPEMLQYIRLRYLKARPLLVNFFLGHGSSVQDKQISACRFPCVRANLSLSTLSDQRNPDDKYKRGLGSSFPR